MKFLHIPLFIITLLLLIAGTNSAIAQKHLQIAEIKSEFVKGSIDINTAVQAQLNILNEDTQIISGDKADQFTKCVTPVLSLINTYEAQLNAKTKSLITQTFGTRSKVLDKQLLSASGKFTIHYDTSGVDAVPSADGNNNGIPDYVEWAAEAADSSYNHEIITLGFTDPIPNGHTYDIFLEDLSTFDAYGLTNDGLGGTFGCETSSPATCIFVENDFDGFPPNTDPEGDQKGALKVTIAHEFKHAIQFVQNNWRGDSDRWAEMDATLMEEVVYDNVNDYYNYIVDFSTDLFSSADRTLSAGSYEDITFALFFHEHVDPHFWTDVWDRITNNSSIRLLDAVEETLTSYSLDYNATLLEAYMWHFASGLNYSDATYGFDESTFYPDPVFKKVISEFTPVAEDTSAINATSAHYYLLQPRIESEGFFKLGLYANSSGVQAGLLVYDAETGLISPYYLTSAVAGTWTDYEFDWKLNSADKIGLVIVNSDLSNPQEYAFTFSDYFISSNDTIEIVKSIELEQNYPNPFNPSTTIRVEIGTPQQVRLEIFDYMGRKVQSIYNGSLNRGFHNFFVDGSNLASGTYFYRLISEEGVYTKKMMLIK